MSAVVCLQLEPTSKCNFGCKFCCGRYMPQGNMDINIFRDIIESLPDLKYVQLQGEGESLMHKDFFKMVEYLNNKKILVSFITNGSLLTEANISKLLDLKIEVILVSIESADASTFRRIRKGSLEPVQNGIRNFIDEKIRRNLETPLIGFAVSVLRSTLDDLPGIINLYNNLKMDGGICVQFLQNMESYLKYDDDETRRELLTNDEMKRHKDKYGDIIDQINRNSKEIKLFYQFLYQDFPADEKHWPPRSGCPWLEKGLFINFEGMATACCMIKNSQKFGLGNAHKDINSILIERENMLAGMKKGIIPEACKECPPPPSMFNT